MKNLKTKDYLGKARLVAASDRANAFTGFQGAEMKKAVTIETAKDDRPEESISYAATNLVQRNLTSRSRQQSEPPMSRNMFPPTPPPEADKPASMVSSGPGSNGVGSNAMTGRAASVRNGPGRPPQRTDTDPYAPRMGQLIAGSMDRGTDRPMDRGTDRGMDRPIDRGLDRMQDRSADGPMDRGFGRPLERPTDRGTERPRDRSVDRGVGGDRATDGTAPPRGQSPGPGMLRNNMSPPMERPRLGTMRTASEPRGPPARQYSQRGPTYRPPLFRETTPQRPFETVQEDAGYDDVYDMYQAPRGLQGVRRAGSKMSRQQRFSNEEDDYASDAYEDDSVGEEDFEMMGGRMAPPLRTQRPSGSMRGGSRRPDIRKIRVKVHADDDTRYIVIGPAVEFGDLEGRIREKFGFKSRLKIRMQDDGDMITMGDQDDLDMLISSAKQIAKKEKSDMGKMEVSDVPVRPTAKKLILKQVWVQEWR